MNLRNDINREKIPDFKNPKKVADTIEIILELNKQQ